MNAPGIMENLLNLFRGLLNEKMKERFNVHNSEDYTILHDAIGKDILPEEYGGTNGSLLDHTGKKFSKKNLEINKKNYLPFCLFSKNRFLDSFNINY